MLRIEKDDLSPVARLDRSALCFNSVCRAAKDNDLLREYPRHERAYVLSVASTKVLAGRSNGHRQHILRENCRTVAI
jgi:hypothetical protein